MDEKELIDRLKQGDLSAQDTVWTDNFPKVREYLCRATRPRGNTKNGKWQADFSDANDIVAQTFFEFFKDVPKFRGECKVSTYLLYLARTNLKDFYRKYDQERSVLNSPIVADGDGASRFDGDDGAAALDFVDRTDEAKQMDMRLEMRDELQSLSPTQRDVVLYRIFSGMTAAETGQVMDMSADAVDSCFYRAIKTLRGRQMIEASRKAGEL